MSATTVAARAAITVAAVLVATGVRAAPEPRFEPGPCTAFAHVPPRLAQVECGWVEVPERWDVPTERRWRLAVVVVRASRPRRDAAPLVWLHGGPGSRGIERLARLADGPLALARDLVVYDQRGGGESRPRHCPTVRDELLLVQARDLDGRALAEAEARVLLDCRASLDAAGVDPAAYGTSANLGDLEQVRRALGYERVALWGSSYGAALAGSYAAAHPERVAALVLDSPYLPDPLPLSGAQRYELLLETWFRGCEAHPRCSQRFPGIRGQYAEALQGLGEAGLRVPDVPLVGGRVGRFVMNAPDLQRQLQGALARGFDDDTAGRLVEAAARGDVQALRPLVAAALGGGDALSLAAWVGTECRDRPRLHAGLPDGPPHGAEPLMLHVACPLWSPPGEPPRLPEGTTIPTLVLSGDADFVTPLPFAEQAVARIGPAARLLRMPRLAHGLFNARCTRDTVAAFLRDPAAEPDNRCAGPDPQY